MADGPNAKVFYRSFFEEIYHAEQDEPEAIGWMAGYSSRGISDDAKWRSRGSQAG